MITTTGEAADPTRSTRAPTRIDQLVTCLFAPIDSASMSMFRIGFGLIMAWWCFDELRSGRVQALYITPKFHFTYYVFRFVQPWAGDGMYFHFAMLGLLALSIALGFVYRIAAFLFACGFTYVFLLERTNYQNHYYLICLLSWLLTVLPLNRMASLDVLAELVEPSSTSSTWCLWLIRFHVALPYVFGGLAKFHSDWLAGEPLRSHLNVLSKSWGPFVGTYLTSDVVVYVLVWGGLVFDLAVVPLLLWRPTRMAAYSVCVLFHLMNATLFHIHVFPWLMICATTIFFEPGWPRSWHRTPYAQETSPLPLTWSSLSIRNQLISVLVGGYCLFHVLWPLRHHLYPGNSSWTERGHYFSWRMMLRTKVSAIRCYVTDRTTAETQIASLRPYLSVEQVSSFARDPEMILQMAHFLAEEYQQRTNHPVEVRALVLTSLNGRKPELLIDPNYNLASEPLGFYKRTWIKPLTEPLRRTAWSVPMRDWENHVNVPPATFPQPALTHHNVPPVRRTRSGAEPDMTRSHSGG